MFSNPQTFEQEGELLKTIANPTRLALIYALAQKEQTVNSLVATFGLEQSLVSHHLIKLKDRGVLKTRRDGKCIFYSVINPQGLIEILQAVQNVVKGELMPQVEPLVSLDVTGSITTISPTTSQGVDSPAQKVHEARQRLLEARTSTADLVSN